MKLTLITVLMGLLGVTSWALPNTKDGDASKSNVLAIRDYPPGYYGCDYININQATTFAVEVQASATQLLNQCSSANASPACNSTLASSLGLELYMLFCASIITATKTQAQCFNDATDCLITGTVSFELPLFYADPPLSILTNHQTAEVKSDCAYDPSSFQNYTTSVKTTNKVLKQLLCQGTKLASIDDQLITLVQANLEAAMNFLGKYVNLDLCGPQNNTDIENMYISLIISSTDVIESVGDQVVACA
ncbi:hypothetical protein MMC06_003868 [Schaereria dolodes]|nr:hypothetical protein [Schaereria dolodes]